MENLLFRSQTKCQDSDKLSVTICQESDNIKGVGKMSGLGVKMSGVRQNVRSKKTSGVGQNVRSRRKCQVSDSISRVGQ